ncbi:TPA: hypothetical protein NJ081_004561, partial [Vibrio parahaemolyticus]|nr:hypothetical protein [Vibrio parahaemolyticus]
EPMQKVEGLILAKQLRNPRNACFSWMLSNVILKQSDAKTMYPTKATSESKIDGAMALFMALNRALLNKDISLDGFLDSPLIF